MKVRIVTCLALVVVSLAFARLDSGNSQKQYVEAFANQIRSQRKSGSTRYVQLRNTTIISPTHACDNKVPYQTRVAAAEACVECVECIGFNMSEIIVEVRDQLVVRSFYNIWTGRGFRTDQGVTASLFKISRHSKKRLLGINDVRAIDVYGGFDDNGNAVGTAQRAVVEIQYADGATWEDGRIFNQGGPHTERDIVGETQDEAEIFAHVHANRHGGVVRMSWFSQRTPCGACQGRIMNVHNVFRARALAAGHAYNGEVGWRTNNANGNPVVGGGAPLPGQALAQPGPAYYAAYGDMVTYPNMPKPA